MAAEADFSVVCVCISSVVVIFVRLGFIVCFIAVEIVLVPLVAVLLCSCPSCS